MIVTVTGIDEAIAKLEKAEEIEKPILEGILEVLQEAESIVSTRYSLQGNGNEDFVTDIEEIPNGYMLTVSGEDVGFLEFGAGVFTEADEFADEVGFPVAPWSWSESHPHSENPNARYGAKNGFWWYNNIRYTGLAPMRGMQQALDHVRNTIQGVVERKIAEWIGN